MTFKSVMISTNASKHTSNRRKKASGSNLSVFSLWPTSTWPIGQGGPPSFSLPKELEACSNVFEKFYMDQHSGKKLTWLHNLAKGEAKTNYTTTNKVGYILQGSGFQIGILLQFNRQNEYSVKDLQQTTQITENVFMVAIRTLLKTKVLLSNPELPDPEKDALDGSVVLFLNKQYRGPKGKLKVNINVPLKAVGGEGGEGGASGGGAGESAQEMQNVIEERKMLMQAAIVRVMKARKRLKHNDLITEVVDQLKPRFKPQIPLIKKCIDILIEKEFLERVKGEKDLYSYVA